MIETVQSANRRDQLGCSSALRWFDDHVRLAVGGAFGRTIEVVIPRPDGGGWAAPLPLQQQSDRALHVVAITLHVSTQGGDGT